MNNDNNNRYVVSNQQIANYTPQPSRPVNSNNISFNNNNNNNIVPCGNTYSLSNINNLQQRTDDQRNHRSPTNLPTPNSQTTNLLIHSRPSPHNSRFAALNSSPALIDTANTISIGTLNVRSISKTSKFDALFDDIFDASLSIIGLQETRISETNADVMFKLEMVSRSCGL